MAKYATRWAEWKKDFHEKRQQLRVMLRSSRTQSIREAFPEFALDDEGEPVPRGRMITAILSDFTKDFYEKVDKVSEEVAQRESEKIKDQIRAFHS